MRLLSPQVGAAVLAALTVIGVWIGTALAQEPLARANHPNGLVVEVTKVSQGDRTIVLSVVASAGDVASRLARSGRETRLEDNSGGTYSLVTPPDNREIEIAPRSTLEGDLVFSGRLGNEAKRLTLRINPDSGSADEPRSTIPALDIELKLPEAATPPSPATPIVMHANGLSLRLISAKRYPQAIVAHVEATTGDRAVRLNRGGRELVLRPAAGEPLALAAGEADEVAVPALSRADLTLVFPISQGQAMGDSALVTNAISGLADDANTPIPQLELALARVTEGAGEPPETSRILVEPIEPGSVSISQLKSDLGAIAIKGGTLVRLPGDILFDFDKADIRADAEATLGQLADLIRRTDPAGVSIVGHTDSKGDDAYNQDLSVRRAQAVAGWLAKDAAGPLFETSGVGETQPVASNENADGTDNPANRQLNRRVDVLLRTPEVR